MGGTGVVEVAKEPETEGKTSASNEDLLPVYMSRIAKRVRDARRHLKLKQSELGAKVGSNQRYIFLVEAARANLTLRNLIRLANALDIKPEDMLMPEQTDLTLDESSVQHLARLVESYTQEMRSTASNLAQADQTLHQLHSLFEKHMESSRIARLPEK